MGDALWCRHLVATLGALERKEGAARERVRIAARGTDVEAMSYRVGMVKVEGCDVVAMAMLVGVNEVSGTQGMTFVPSARII